MSDSRKSRSFETDINTQTTGIPGTREDVEDLLELDGKVLRGGEGYRYATGRRDGEAPEFPGVHGKLQ